MKAGSLCSPFLPEFPGPGPTFDKELRAALLTPHHTLVGCIVSQRALADGQGALGTNGLEDVPGQGTEAHQGSRGCPTELGALHKPHAGFGLSRRRLTCYETEGAVAMFHIEVIERRRERWAKSNDLELDSRSGEAMGEDTNRTRSQSQRGLKIKETGQCSSLLTPGPRPHPTTPAAHLDLLSILKPLDLGVRIGQFHSKADLVAFVYLVGRLQLLLKG